MFRYERKQKGRYRQFNQFGVEAILVGLDYLAFYVQYMNAQLQLFPQVLM
jgi:histidyl-tRNA synthetase